MNYALRYIMYLDVIFTTTKFNSKEIKDPTTTKQIVSRNNLEITIT